MADEDIKIVISGDSSNAVSSIKDVDKAVRQVSKTVSDEIGTKVRNVADQSFGRLGGELVSIFTAIPGPIKIAGAAIVGFGAAMKGAFESAVFAEQMGQLNKQFEILTANAGVSGNAILTDLVQRAEGLADTDDLVKALNKSTLELGSNVANIGPVFDLAKQASLAFGGDAIQNFEAFSQAIATGNTRSLRQFGLIVNASEATKKYAAELGIAESRLSQTQQQQALLNAVLERGQAAFAGISSSQAPIQTSIKKTQVALSEAGEAIAEAFGSVAAPAITYVLGLLERVATNFANFFKAKFGEGVDAAVAQQARLRDELVALEEQQQRMISAAGGSAILDPMQFQLTQKRIADVRLEMSLLDEQMRKSQTQAREMAESNKAFSESLAIDPEKQRAALVAAEQATIQANQGRIDSMLAMATTEEEIQRLSKEKISMMNAEFELQSQERDRLAKENGIINTMEYQAQREALEAQHQARLQGFSAQTAQKLSEDTKIIRSGIVSGLTSAFSALGAALAKGENGFAAFSKAAIGAVGSIAINVGAMLVTMGLGFQSMGIIFPAWAAAGTGAVIQGLALITLGGALQALGSGGGDTVSAGGGGGGGGGSFGGGEIAQPGTSFQDVERSNMAAVTVNVQGSILDRRETGLAIAEIIQESFDSQRTRVVGAV